MICIAMIHGYESAFLVRGNCRVLLVCKDCMSSLSLKLSIRIQPTKDIVHLLPRAVWLKSRNRVVLCFETVRLSLQYITGTAYDPQILCYYLFVKTFFYYLYI